MPVATIPQGELAPYARQQPYFPSAVHGLYAVTNYVEHGLNQLFSIPHDLGDAGIIVPVEGQPFLNISER